MIRKTISRQQQELIGTRLAISFKAGSTLTKATQCLDIVGRCRKVLRDKNKVNSCVDIKYTCEELSKLDKVASVVMRFDGINIQTRQDRLIAPPFSDRSAMVPPEIVAPRSPPSAIATHLHKLVS